MAHSPIKSISLPQQTKRHYWLYVLKLEDSNYYIGITTRNVDIRMREHLHGFAGARWTKKHKPIKVLDKKDMGVISSAEVEIYEQKVTEKYIKKYGLKNVRGGFLTYPGDYHRIGKRYFEDYNYEAL